MRRHSDRKLQRRARAGILLLGVPLMAVFLFSSCANRKQEVAQRYHLEGKVVSVDLNDGTATIDHKAIPGFMEAMTMPYAAENPSDLKKLEPGDEITADLVVEQGVPLLANITVTKKAPPEGGPAKR
jgi:Cu/Ag efflux protein CusF